MAEADAEKHQDFKAILTTVRHHPVDHSFFFHSTMTAFAMTSIELHKTIWGLFLMLCTNLLWHFSLCLQVRYRLLAERFIQALLRLFTSLIVFYGLHVPSAVLGQRLMMRSVPAVRPPCSLSHSKSSVRRSTIKLASFFCGFVTVLASNLGVYVVACPMGFAGICCDG